MSVFYKCRVFCQVDVSTTDGPFVQKKRIECEFVTECDQVNSNNPLL